MKRSLGLGSLPLLGFGLLGFGLLGIVQLGFVPSQALAQEPAPDESVPAPSAPDEPIWQRYDVVDAHGHVGKFEGFDLDLKHLLAGAERFGIRKVLVSNIDGAALEQTADLDEAETNQRTLRLIRRYSDLLRGIAWARPVDGSAQALAPFLDERLPGGAPAFVAIKLHPEMNGFPADDERVDPYFELARKHGIPIVYHCGTPDSSSGPKRILTAARRHPDVPVVLYHMGFRRSHEGAVAAVADAVNSGAADVYLGTAQADPAAVVEAVRTVGADRVIFGTDAVYFGAEHWERYVPMVDALAAALSAEDLALVLGGNARRLFRLGE